MATNNYTDEELLEKFNFWLDHYTKYGESHYKDTKDWKILEIYYDRILDRTINDLVIEDDDVEYYVDRIGELV